MAEKAPPATLEVAAAIAAGMPACPICNGRNVRRSESARFKDRIMAWFRYSPFRCRTCRRRFYTRSDQHPASG